MRKSKVILWLLGFPVLFSFTVNNSGGGLPEIVSVKATDTAMIFTITTQSYGGNYSPMHVLAIWVTDNNDIFKKTLKLCGSVYTMHLVKWKQMSGGNSVDAITGPTLTSHITHTAIWDGKDINGNVLPDGTYKVYIEFTEDNSLSPSVPDGPWVSFIFTKGTSQVQNPPNVSFTYYGQNKTVYKDIKIETFNPLSVDYQKEGLQNIIVSPNPIIEKQAQIRIILSKPLKLNLAIYSSTDKVIHQYPDMVYSDGEHIFFWYPNIDGVKSGIYFVKILINDKYVLSKKIIVK